MLYIVLILVLTALGLLVTALITANSLWAWISIGLSVLAGLVLVVDFLRRRRKRRATVVSSEEKSADEVKDEAAAEEDAEETSEKAESSSAPAKTAQPPAAEEKPDEGDPAEEQTDPDDLLVVSELEIEVVVVDEYPRYHVTDCGWLADRDTIPIAVKEARELGFTPCSRCRPDAKLATRHRDATHSESESAPEPPS